MSAPRLADKTKKIMVHLTLPAPDAAVVLRAARAAGSKGLSSIVRQAVADWVAARRSKPGQPAAEDY